MPTKRTPAMQQYVDLKQQYPDCVLLFRLGDFYEVFREDAQTCHKVLDLVLTSRNKNDPDPIPMAGLPYHSVDKYIRRLIDRGYKVAIAEQMTEPKPGQVIKRQVTSVITPGTYIDEQILKPSYIVAVTVTTKQNVETQCIASLQNFHLARGDFSDGTYQTATFATWDDAQKLLLTLAPSEIVLPLQFPDKDQIHTNIQPYIQAVVSVAEIPHDPVQFLQQTCHIQTLQSFGMSLQEGRETAFALLVSYLLRSTSSLGPTAKGGGSFFVSRVQYYSPMEYVLLDHTTSKNLELFTSAYDGSERYSLFGVLATTKTGPGTRLLREWLMQPLKTAHAINERLDHSTRFVSMLQETRDIVKKIGTTYDIAKAASTIVYKKPLPVQFLKIRKTLDVVFKEEMGRNGTPTSRDIASLEKQKQSGGGLAVIARSQSDEAIHVGAKMYDTRVDVDCHASNIKSEARNADEYIFSLASYLQNIGCSGETLQAMRELHALLRAAFVDDDVVTNEVDFIRDGYDAEIDELRQIAYHSDDLLIRYQQDIVQKTGLTNIKVKFVLNQGYFIEITPKDVVAFEAASVRDDLKFDFLRRQTLKTGERYTTPYLETIQGKILTAKDRLAAKEKQILLQMQGQIKVFLPQLLLCSHALAMLDIFTSHAVFAAEKNYTRPTFTPGDQLRIIGGRHPVIEAFLPPHQQFIVNDLCIGRNEKKQEEMGKNGRKREKGFDPVSSGSSLSSGSSPGGVHIITGPNMGGKSTYLRQNALIVLLAHCGLRVPATTAELCLVDGIFARVGSGDVLAKNQSTFMTEMIEVASILHNATAKSFVIFDELGRGTSTYDGLALTQAIITHIATQIQCKTLVATHYHELIELAQTVPSVHNFSVSVYETDKDVVFLKKIAAGGADKSYGIDVAKLAGIPATILHEAREILGNLNLNLSTLDGYRGPSGRDLLLNGQPPALETSGSLQERGRGGGLFPDSPNSLLPSSYEKIKTLLTSFDSNHMTPLQALQLVVKLQEEVGKNS